SAWDQGLIKAMVWDWGAYVDRLEAGWLASADAHATGIDGGTPEQWANDSHGVAATVWQLRPADNVLDDRYLRDVLPMLDRQLGDIVQHVKCVSGGVDPRGHRQALRPVAVVDVAAHHVQRRERAQRREHLGPADVARVDDEVRAAQRIERLRAQKPVRIGD